MKTAWKHSVIRKAITFLRPFLVSSPDKSEDIQARDNGNSPEEAETNYKQLTVEQKLFQGGFDFFQSCFILQLLVDTKISMEENVLTIICTEGATADFQLNAPILHVTVSGLVITYL